MEYAPASGPLPRLATGTCGGRGICGSCRFELLDGAVTTGVYAEATEKEKDLMRLGVLGNGQLLGCNCRYEGRVPARVEFVNGFVELKGGLACRTG